MLPFNKHILFRNKSRDYGLLNVPQHTSTREPSVWFRSEWPTAAVELTDAEVRSVQLIFILLARLRKQLHIGLAPTRLLVIAIHCHHSWIISIEVRLSVRLERPTGSNVWPILPTRNY